VDRQSLQRLCESGLAIGTTPATIKDAQGGEKKGRWRWHTLMKPPSGFARRKGGCELTLGRKSAGDRIFFNSGT